MVSEFYFRFAHAFFGVVDIRDMLFATIVRSVWGIFFHDIDIGQERKLVFEYAFNFSCCEVSRYRFSGLVLYPSTVDEVKVKFQ